MPRTIFKRSLRFDLPILIGLSRRDRRSEELRSVLGRAKSLSILPCLCGLMLYNYIAPFCVRAIAPRLEKMLLALRNAPLRSSNVGTS